MGANMKDEQVMTKEWDHFGSLRALARAVIQVYELFEAQGKMPGSEDWNYNRNYFLRYARPAILAKWCEDREANEEDFPWTDDRLVHTWVTWRKAGRVKQEEIKKGCGLKVEVGLYGQQ